MKKQEFVGGAIGSVVVGKIVGAALDAAMDRIQKSPRNKANAKDIPDIRANVEREIGPVIQHYTNREPAYKSRVTIGSAAAAIVGAASIVQLWADGHVNTWEDYSPHVAVVMGAVFALYGRWAAKKPL